MTALNSQQKFTIVCKRYNNVTISNIKMIARPVSYIIKNKSGHQSKQCPPTVLSNANNAKIIIGER